MTNLAKDLDFSGRRILVTGAANGFGAAIADTFAQQNGSLVLADIEEVPLRTIAQRLGAWVPERPLQFAAAGVMVLVASLPGAAVLVVAWFRRIRPPARTQPPLKKRPARA